MGNCEKDLSILEFAKKGLEFSDLSPESQDSLIKEICKQILKLKSDIK